MLFLNMLDIAAFVQISSVQLNSSSGVGLLCSACNQLDPPMLNNADPRLTDSLTTDLYGRS